MRCRGEPGVSDQQLVAIDRPRGSDAAGIAAIGASRERRFARIEGVADREPLIADDPADPRNRRMSILLMD